MSMSPAQSCALDYARHLIECGVPVFVAEPALDRDGNWQDKGGSGGTGYRLPRNWQNTPADPATLDGWKPGMALCAVMGHTVDALDVDPRNGGTDSLAAMVAVGLVPVSYGEQETPSGGRHYLIAALGVHSLDGVRPGVDLKAGADDGGRGFVFLAPTARVSKATGEVVAYRWAEPPDLTALALIGGDDTGAALAAAVRPPETAPAASYDGPPYAALPQGLRDLADAEVARVVGVWRDKVRDAEDWPEGQRGDDGRGWETIARDAAWAVARLTVAPWSGLDEDTGRERYESLLGDVLGRDPKCAGKWTPALLRNAAAASPDAPPWDGLDVATVDPEDPYPALPTHLDDAHLAEWMAHRGLGGEWCWAGGLGWMWWDGRRWVARRDEDAREAVRAAVIWLNKHALDAGATPARIRELHGLLSNGRIGGLVHLMRGVVSVDGGEFDQNPDLLNVGNGVIDLSTGELLPHDPDYRMSRITETDYVPGATHPDWDQALTALDEEVAEWMQVRFGQAVTGYPTSDDVLPIGQGGGSNGKSTLLSALYVALGEHMALVPEKLLRAGPNDHPTELMSLFGVRVAVVDETPEAGHLDVPRLKATVGQERMTARRVYKDNVSWKATHSLFVMTNYVPAVHETDHGTWRRLALVRFTKTFPKDDRFRARLAAGKGGRSEAVLAWVVAGAVRWYAADRLMPPAPARVVQDTREWRQETDLVLAYITDRIVFDASASVTTSDLLEDVNSWLTVAGHHIWSDKLLTSRFGSHEEVTGHHVTKVRTRDPKSVVPRYPNDRAPDRARVWQGIRWRTANDDREGAK